MTIWWLFDDYPMTIRWLSDDYPMNIQWLSNDYPMTIQWLSNDYQMTLQWLSWTFDLFFLMIIDLKRSIDRRLLFKSGAMFIRQGPLLTWSKWVGEPDYIFILRWPRYLGADMRGAEKVICYLPVYSEPVSCRPVELPSICLSWRTTILRYIVKDNI